MKLTKKNKKLIKKALLRYLFVVIASALVGYSAYSVNASKLAGDTVPMPFGVGAAVVMSGSMEPVYSVGDILIVVKSDSFSIGDVIVYQTGRTAVAHKIVAFTDGKIVTKGEANNTEDDPIPFDSVKGKVLFAIPKVGSVVDFIRTPFGTISIIAVALFLLDRSYKSEKSKEDSDVTALKTEIEKLKKNQTDK